MSGRVTQNQIELMSREFKQETFRLILRTDELNRFAVCERRFENAVCNQLRDQIRDSDPKADWPVTGSAIEHVPELTAEAEDFVCVLKGELTGFGEREPPAGALEQLLPQTFLERSDLPADRRLGKTQLFASACNAAFLLDDPKI